MLIDLTWLCIYGLWVSAHLPKLHFDYTVKYKAEGLNNDMYLIPIGEGSFKYLLVLLPQNSSLYLAETVFYLCFIIVYP